MSDVLDADEVAALLRVKPETATAWARHGRIPAHKVGRGLLFLSHEIVQWISEQPFDCEWDAKWQSLPTTLYRHFDDDGKLLYVGIAVDFKRRNREHRTSPWALQIARITIDEFPDRHSASAAETAAIRGERPRYNKIHAK